MNLKKIIPVLVFILFLTLFGCGSEDKEEEEDCPRFYDYQIYPEVGRQDTEFEILVILKQKSENRQIAKIKANIYHSDGRSAQISLDMVQSNADPYRFVRSFMGNEVCEEGTCKYFFKVVATHATGCVKTFNSSVFVVETSTIADDDDSTDDDDSKD